MKMSILTLCVICSLNFDRAQAQTEVVAVVGAVVTEIAKNEMKEKPTDYGPQLNRMESDIKKLMSGQQTIIALINDRYKALSMQINDQFLLLHQSNVVANAAGLDYALAEETEKERRAAFIRLEAEVQKVSAVLGGYSALAFPSALASHQTQTAIYMYLDKPKKMREARRKLACNTLKPWLYGAKENSFSSILSVMDTDISIATNKLESQAREVVIQNFPGRKSPLKEETCKHYELRESIVGDVKQGFNAEYRTQYWDCYRIMEHDRSGGRTSLNLPESPKSSVSATRFAGFSLLLNAYAFAAWGSASKSDVPPKSERLERFNEARSIIIGLQSNRDEVKGLQQSAQTLYDALEGAKLCQTPGSAAGS